MTNPEMNSLDINQIKEYLPHRYPMLLVDRVLDWQAGKYLTAIKNVSINEEFFQGHFSNKPVMPGVLMIEAMAQSAALLSFLTTEQKPNENSIVYFIGIDDARFKRPVVPGDQLRMHVEIQRCARGIWKYKTQATVDGHLAVAADLMCTMRNADDASLPAG